MFVERFEEQRVQSKGIIRLEAKVTGNPQPEIAWFRNNKRLKPSKNIREIYDGESILLEIGCGEDGMEDGDYKCVATNSVGKASHGARVTVEADKIKFTKKLHNVEVEEGNVAKFECHTSQAINVKWYFNNLEISTTDKSKYEIITEAKKHILIIKKVEEHDAGQVKCTAKDQSTQATLIIRESGVEFVRKLVDFEVKEREMAILEVEVSSNNAEVSWHKDGEELKFGDDRFEFEKEGTVRKLLIRCTSVHDEGEYTCALGEQECTAEVTVVELPPEIISRMHDVTIAKGERATFEIELTKGDALVRWFKDGAELQFSEHVQLAIDGKRQRLMVYNSVADDEGEYSCQVGEQTSVAYLKVEEPAVQFITRLPDVTLTPLKSDAVFTVELSLPDIEVVWLRNGKPIKASDRYEMSAEGGIRRLVIKKVTMEDQSEYSCLAINVRTNTKLKVEIIETVPRINMDLTKKDYRVRKGEDVEITVKYSGIPKPKDEWFVNGKLIRPSKKISTSIDDSSATLTIKKVQEEDCGDLTLKLTNNCGEASAELTLIIMQSPSQPGTPEVIEVTNESVTLHWRAPEHDGNTKITNYILEYHDKVDVLSWTKVTESISETTHKVTKLQQNMEYMFRVTAQNEVGPSPPSGTSRYIRITQPGTSEPPVIQQPLSDVISGLGVPATLQCVIGGVPEPEIKWLRDGKVFKTKTMTYENRIAKFTVNQVSETSGATFTCQATNQAGVAETSAKLIVQEKPRLETDETLLSQKLRVSSQWKIEVKFSGFPKPEISWSRDGRRLESNKKCSVYVDETSTTIAIYTLTREDSGVYKVTATNSAGSTTLDLNLRVIDDTERLNKSRSPSEEPIDKPGRPEGPLVVKKIQKESVTIEWKPPADDGGLDISKYSVEKCDVTKMQWMKVADIEGAITSYAIQRLNEGSEYMFRVFAANPIGYSEALESDTVVVKSQHEPPSPPRGPLDLTGMTDTSLTIKWQAPESDGGCAILEYLVERREVSKKAWQKVGSTESQHIEVTSLKLNTSYHFRITAINEVGQSSPFAPEEAITVGKRITPPSKPTNLTVVDVTSRSVTLEWGPPASTGGTEITGYIIEKRITTSKTYEKVVTLEPSVSQYCILNLKEKSEFYFRVYAENAMGLSEPAETQRVRLKTHASPPSPPTAPLETRGTGPNSIVIAWGIPESDGGAPIEGYTIAIKDTRKTMWMEVGRVKADVQKLNIRDLQEGHTYMLRIFARNEVGQSEALESEEPVVVLRPAATCDVPGRPEDFTINDMTPCSVRIGWKSPSCDGGAQLIKYVVDIVMQPSKDTSSRLKVK